MNGLTTDKITVTLKFVTRKQLADIFTKNSIAFLVEERLALDIKCPQSFVFIDPNI